MKLWEHDDLRKYVVTQLKSGLPPETIAGRMKQQCLPYYASKHAIYQFLYAPQGQQYCKYLHSKRYVRRKKKPPKPKRTLIPNKTSIHDRPDHAGEYCHFEADTIVSGKHTGSTTALSTVYDPESMYIDARKIPDFSKGKHTKALLRMLKKFKYVHSITQDNGIENIDHELLQRTLHTRTYFCDPHSPWQKPGIENANKLIRRFIPKGADISLYSDAYIRSRIKQRNNTPRKKLGYKTPNEVIREQKLLKNRKPGNS